MQNRISLEQVRVGTPCHVPLASMSGDERKRFCSHCRKHVHNLSAMTRTETERLICESAGDLCVVYQPDARGAPLTLEYASVAPARRWRRLWPVACLLALAAGVVSFVRKPAPPVFIMGEMAIMPTQTPTTPSNTP